MAKENIITALDIGTTKICCLIAIIDKSNQIKICGVGEIKSKGLSQGTIKNIRAASESIDKAINEAEKMANRNARNLFVGVAGELIVSFVRHGIANIVSKSKFTEEVDEYEVTEFEIEQVKKDAIKNTPIPNNRKIIYVEPQYFKVDNMSGILDPIGMTGHRLEADVHFVTADLSFLNNIYRSIQMIGLNVKDVILQPIASAMAVLNQDERELGSILVDIGGGTTDISIYYQNSIRFSSIIPFGGENITNDLAVGLRTPKSEAEKIKIDYGFALPDNADKSLKVEIPGIGGRPATTRSQKFIAEIINPRVQEIVNLVYKEVEKSKYLNMITAGISVCGGTANLRSTNQLFAKIFNGLPTKTGYPSFNGIYGDTETLSNPKYATVVGLLYWGKKNIKNRPMHTDDKEPIIEKLKKRIRNWFEIQNFT